MANDGCESEDGSVRIEETVDGKDQSNIVTSFVEKAIGDKCSNRGMKQFTKSLSEWSGSEG